MNAPQSTGKSRRGTFSLATLFLIVTSAGVGSVAFRVASDKSFGEKAALAVIFVGAFLSLWYFVTFQYRRLQLAVLLSFGGMFLSALLAVPVDHIHSYRLHCANNLKQIGLALLSYHQTYGSFPPAYTADANGKPLLSWRVLILPFMELDNLAKMVHSDEAWDGPNNTKWAERCVAGFNCPDDPQPSGSASRLTSYLGVVGPHAAWSGATPRKLSDFKNPSKTILLVEVAHAGVHWAEPRDLYIGQMSPGINPSVGQGISSGHAGGGANVLFADGAVRFLPNSTDPKKLAEMLDLDGCSDQAAIDGEGR